MPGVASVAEHSAVCAKFPFRVVRYYSVRVAARCGTVLSGTPAAEGSFRFFDGTTLPCGKREFFMDLFSGRYGRHSRRWGGVCVTAGERCTGRSGMRRGRRVLLARPGELKGCRPSFPGRGRVTSGYRLPEDGMRICEKEIFQSFYGMRIFSIFVGSVG